MIVERSDCDNDRDVDEDTSQASKEVNKIAVETPPKIRPKRRKG